MNLFNAFKVNYLVVGEYAYAIYAEPRYTPALELWVGRSLQNAVSLFQALERFGAPLHDLDSDDFASSPFIYHLGNEPVGVCISSEYDGAIFTDAWNRRKNIKAFGSVFSFIAYEDFLENKKKLLQSLDESDIEFLERAKQWRKQD